MRMTQILGAVALVIGVVLLGFAYHASNAPLNQVSNAITGRFTDQRSRPGRTRRPVDTRIRSPRAASYSHTRS
jgi:hypothetical protein